MKKRGAEKDGLAKNGKIESFKVSLEKGKLNNFVNLNTYTFLFSKTTTKSGSNLPP